MQTDDYRVKLEQFEGPLDLLLYLIRRNEVDIADIPVAGIAEQYMEFLGQIDRVDIDLAGEFLVMAATLTEIKSRLLMPAPARRGPARQDGSADDTPEDPRAELVRQLLEYKTYRDAAGVLEQRLGEWAGRAPAGHAVSPASPDEAPEEEALGSDDIELVDLVNAFARIMESVNFDRLGSHEVSYDDTPIELHAADIVDRLTRLAESGDAGSSTPAELELGSLVSGRTRSEMIGLFLAVLDLVRRGRLAVRQDRVEASIYLALRQEDADGPRSADGTGVPTT